MLSRQTPIGRNSASLETREEAVRGAAEVFKDAKATTAALKATLKTQPPWSRDVEFHRQKARNFYMTLLFSHPLSTYAQSLDHLWLDTSYTLIIGYRDIVSRLEATLPAAQYNGPGNGVKKPKQNSPAVVELRKSLTRFRQALHSEDTFYRNLLTRLVAFYQLQPLVSNDLSAVQIPSSEHVENGGPREGLAPVLPGEEREKKLGLIYKGLICLGDLERYKEQYSEKARKEVREGWRGNGEERFVKAKMFYEAARRIQPDNGVAFNQMAVISSYSSDNFLCVYHYFRALAVKLPFPGGEGNLERILKKIFDKWRNSHQDDARVTGEGISRDEVEELKKDFLVVLAILFLKTGITHLPTLRAKTLPQLAKHVRERNLPAEIVVKLTATVIGSHWHARMCTSVVSPSTDRTSPAKRTKRPDSEEIALDYLLCIFTVLLQVALTEVEDSLTAKNASTPDSALVDDEEEEDDPQMHLHISAVLRRLLPSLRILSKWLKSNTDYLARFVSSDTQTVSGSLAAFWTVYTAFVNTLGRLFPIQLLPSLIGPLEEERDMKGFTPLKRGYKENNSGETNERGMGLDQVHPNEEQLMRISDILVDAKLLLQAESSGNAFSGALSGATQPLTTTALHTAVPSLSADLMASRNIDEGDMASISTETEDDPVNLAMRATLGEGSSTGDDEERRADDVDDDEEEVIIWGRGSTSTPVNKPTPRAPAPNPTAFDLLQTLALGSTPPGPRQNSAPAPIQPSSAFGTPTIAANTIQNQKAGGQPSPGLLFGGDPSAGNIWSMGREDSGRGSKRVEIDHGISAIWDLPTANTVKRNSFPSPISGLTAAVNQAPSAIGQGWDARQGGLPNGQGSASMPPFKVGPISGKEDGHTTYAQYGYPGQQLTYTASPVWAQPTPGQPHSPYYHPS